MGFDYTVSGNDKGLTYIFLEQAKKQAGFDGTKKIDWNAVMNVFDQIQKEEEAEGESLFRGGTDKTRAGWGSSYQIRKGDRISLSDEQMNKIYSAMGLDLSKTQQTPAQTPTQTPTQTSTQTPAQTPAQTPTQTPTQTPAQTPAQTPTQTPTQTSTQTPAQTQAQTPAQTPAQASMTVPAKDENPPSNTTPPAEAPLEEEFVSPHKFKANQTILNPDGSCYTYDENGYISEVRDKNGNKTREIRYDSNGIWTYFSYEYDSKGNNTRMIIYDPDGSVSQYNDSEYDSKGNKTRVIHYNSDGSVDIYADYEYHANGEVKTTSVYHNDGILSSLIMHDENGKRTYLYRKEE